MGAEGEGGCGMGEAGCGVMRSAKLLGGGSGSEAGGRQSGPSLRQDRLRACFTSRLWLGMIARVAHLLSRERR